MRVRRLIVVSVAVALLALAAFMVYTRQGVSQSAESSGLCRDDKGQLNSPGALRRNADGSMDRCDAGQWVRVPESPDGPQRVSATGAGRPAPQLCRDEQGRINSPGALRRNPKGQEERCEGGRWVPTK